MRRASVALAVVVLTACESEAPPPATPVRAAAPSASAPVASAAPPVRITPDAPFRQAPPAAGPAVVFVAPKITELHLKNGVRVLLVERHDLPIVSVRVVTSGGAGDVRAPAGAASLAGAMLEQGTTTRSALQISDAYEHLGANHATWVGWDSGGASIKVTTEKLDAALGLLADVVLHPTFPTEELERLRARRLAAAQQEKNSPGSMASNATAAALYGRAHPYGHSLSGEPEDIAKVDRLDLVRAHAVLFDPKTTAIVVAGDVSGDALDTKLEAAFGAWPVAAPSQRAREAAPVSPQTGKDAHRLVVVDKPGAVQSVVRLAEVGVAANAPDRDALTVMNTIFGGMFSSRINMNLREAHAYAYGASSRFDKRHGAGPFVAGANVKADTTAASIGELFREARAIQDELVSPEELAGAKESLKLGLPAEFEGVESVTEALANLVVYKRPLDEYATWPVRIDKVSADDVRKAARAHLHPKTLRVIVVGDRAKLEASFEPLHLGAVEARDAYGDLVAPSVKQ